MYTTAYTNDEEYDYPVVMNTYAGHRHTPAEPVIENIVDPTCETDGSFDNAVTAERICKRDHTHVERETAAAIAKTTKEPTETEEGEKTYTATFKNKAFEDQIRKEVIPRKSPKDRAKQMGEDGTPYGRGESLETVVYGQEDQE